MHRPPNRQSRGSELGSLYRDDELNHPFKMLENLVIAVESESQIVDLGRVSGFMQKVRDGII
jgi:hypothetical protein